MVIDYQNRQLFYGNTIDRKTRSKHKKMKKGIDRFNEDVSSRSEEILVSGVDSRSGLSLQERFTRKIHFDEITGMYLVEFERQFPIAGRIVTSTDRNYIFTRDYIEIYEELSSQGFSKFCVEGIKVKLLRDYDLVTNLGKSRARISRGKLFGILTLDENHGIDARPEMSNIDITNEDIKVRVNGNNCGNSWRYHGKIFEVVKRIAEIDG